MLSLSGQVLQVCCAPSSQLSGAVPSQFSITLSVWAIRYASPEEDAAISPISTSVMRSMHRKIFTSANQRSQDSPPMILSPCLNNIVSNMSRRRTGNCSVIKILWRSSICSKRNALCLMCRYDCAVGFRTYGKPVLLLSRQTRAHISQSLWS